MDLLKELCSLAGMSAEWDAADGESFETVAYAAAEKLDVDLVDGGEYGMVTFEGKVYKLTEQAYMDNYGTNGEIRYYAHAEDKDGNRCRVAWDTTAEHDMACELAILEDREEMRQKYGDELSEADAERLAELREMNLPDPSDESIACDWSKPVEVIPV